MIANRTQLADIFGVAKTTVDAWREKGCPIESGGGRGVPVRFDTVKVYQWLTRTGSEVENFTQLLEKEKYREKKRQNDLEEQLVAPVALLTDALAKAAAQIIPIMDSLPLEMKRRNSKLTGHDILLVKKSVAKCRNAIAAAEIDL